MEIFIDHKDGIVANVFEPHIVNIRVKNDKKRTRWYEAVLQLHGEGSFTPGEEQLRKARLRFGILKKGEFSERSVKVYPALPEVKKPLQIRMDVLFQAYDRDATVAESEAVGVTLSFFPDKRALEESIDATARRDR